MKYYKDENDIVYALNPDEDPEIWLDMKVTEISEDEADILCQPKLTQAQRIEMAEEQKQYLLSEAAESIAPLQDAVDLGMETPEEEALLKEWKKYRVLLSRVDTTLAPDIAWPVKP
ncbi:tail fiber assembly protein [Morganella morganii]|uniref:tail fiber assembly protein n=1 Tax=Morganella morganii TaxID=582 RepID=UPI000F843BE1|nr:tail fiber assembly protein [Morganella morganii]RTY28681.1 tail fiber assembly protein [Morganella morganii subsp. morganii]